MQNAARVGDVTCHGGTICSGSVNVLINCLPAAMVGVSLAPCPIPFHCVTPVVCGSGTVLINCMPAARLGDMTGCGSVVASGSPTVFIGP